MKPVLPTIVTFSLKHSKGLMASGHGQAHRAKFQQTYYSLKALAHENYYYSSNARDDPY